MKTRDIATESVNLWKENPSMDYLDAIEIARFLYEGVIKSDKRRSNRTIRKS